MPKTGMAPLRRQQLIEATCGAIAEHGLPATTLNRIARRAAVSSGIIAHYFGDKDALLAAAMRDILRQLGESVTHRKRGAHSAEARLAAIIEGNFDPGQTDPAVARTWLAFWAQAPHQPALARLQRVNQLRLRSNLCHVFAERLPRPAARAAADTLAALIDGFWLRGVLDPEGFDAARAGALCHRIATSLIEEQP